MMQLLCQIPRTAAGDETGGAVPAQVVPRPLEQDEQAILETDKVD